MNKQQQEKYVATMIQTNMWLGYFALIATLAYASYNFNVYAIGIAFAALLVYVSTLLIIDGRFVITVDKKE